MQIVRFSKPASALACLILGALAGAVGTGALRAQSTGLPAFEVAEVSVLDADAYGKLIPKIRAGIKAHGGKYLAAGGRIETFEGSAPAKRVVLIQFPDMESARAWHGSADYKGMQHARDAAANLRSYVVEGLAAQP